MTKVMTQEEMQKLSNQFLARDAFTVLAPEGQKWIVRADGTCEGFTKDAIVMNGIKAMLNTLFGMIHKAQGGWDMAEQTEDSSGVAIREKSLLSALKTVSSYEDGYQQGRKDALAVKAEVVRAKCLNKEHTYRVTPNGMKAFCSHCGDIITI